MDIADKLIYTINKKEERVVDLSREESKVLFTIEETSFLYVRMECSSNANVKIECDTYTLGEKETRNTDGMLVLNNQIDYQLSGGDLYYLPGQYKILYTTSNGTKEFYFHVRRNKELSQEGYYTIIDRIEQLLHGLVFDMRKKGKTQSTTYSLFALKDTLEKEYEPFRNELSYLLNHLNNDLKNVYVRSDSIGRMDSKTIKMNLTHPSYINKPISKKKEMTYDTLENRNLKKMIQEMKNELLQIMISIDWKRENIVFDEEEEIQSFSKKMVKEKMEKDKTEMDAFLNSVGAICQKYFSLCGRILNHPIMKTISDIPTRNYHSRKETELKKRIDDLLDSSKTAYRFKSSQQIFEYYGYYLIHNALSKSGYQLITELDFTSFRENDTCIYYVSSNRIAAVYYGPYCENYLTTDKRDITVSVNSDHKSPDFIIRMYDKNTGEFLFENVFEVKYIPFWKVEAIKDKKEDIIETASDYLQFGYLTENAELKLGVIHKVFVLFVAKEEKVTDLNDLHRIYLLGVTGTDNQKVETFLHDNLLN